MPEVEDVEMADLSNEIQPKAPSVSRGSEASIEKSEEKSDTRNKIIGADDLDMMIKIKSVCICYLIMVSLTLYLDGKGGR